MRRIQVREPPVLLAALVALSLAYPAAAKEKTPPPPAPAIEPDWAAIRPKAEARLKGALFDPGSAQITWTQGFHWGYVKPFLGKKNYQWVGCGTINAKNRMGGYVGAQAFFVGVGGDGTIFNALSGEDALIYDTSCSYALVEPQPALLAAPATMGTLSVADELQKLATLRDKGIITQAEFDQQKAKLLSR